MSASRTTDVSFHPERLGRAVRLITIAWVPILLCCAERILRGTGVYTGPLWLDRLMFLAFALEVLMVWMAVMQRFVALKQERDMARLEAWRSESCRSAIR